MMGIFALVVNVLYVLRQIIGRVRKNYVQRILYPESGMLNKSRLDLITFNFVTF